MTDLASSQFEFSFKRNPISWNNIEVFCENTTAGVNDGNTMFFLNRHPVDLPNAVQITNGGFLFVITKKLEGEYSCGTETEHGVSLSNSKKIVGMYMSTLRIYFLNIVMLKSMSTATCSILLYTHVPD